MTLTERVRAIVQAMPDTASVTLPVSQLREWLDTDANGATSQPAPGAVDLTVSEVAERFGRGVSTVRTWLERGDLPGAYKLHDREWRIPLSAIEHMQDAQAKQHRAPAPRRSRRPADIAAWRKHLPRAS